MKKFNLLTLATLVVALLFTPSAHAESLSVNFENPPYTVGNINGQDGWSSTGLFDQGVVSSPVISGTQSFRISNAVTSGSFGDQTFSKSLTNEAGETSAQNGGMSGGTRQSYFEASWDFKSTSPSSEQPGLAVVASPDRGDGARMSWVQMKDMPTGIEVNFFDYQSGAPDTGSGAGFVLTNVASGLSRSATHTIKITMQFVDGAGNDIVKVYVDGVLMHTGESWEDYFREQELTDTRTVDSILFRVSGTAVPANLGNGFLIDNLSLLSGPSTVKVTINKFVEGTTATSVTANSSDFPMSATWNAANIGAGTGSYVLGVVGHNTANAYEAVTSDMTVGADYSTNEVTGGAVVGATCSTGQPFALTGYTTGDTFSAAQLATPSLTVPSFTNLVSNKYVIVWNEECPTPTPTVTVTPTPDPYALPVACAATGYTYGAPILGTNGANSINGTSGNDLIFALGGTDIVNGGGGNDCIVGGTGSDTLRGGNGKDVLLGEDGADSLDGGNHEDQLYGGDGTDSLGGGNESDMLFGQNGNDSLDGGNGNDTLRGGDGNDSMRGANGMDSLDGEVGNDSANGGSGNQDSCTAESTSACEL